MSSFLQQPRPIEELQLPYDPSRLADKVRRRRRRMRSRLISLAISVVILVAVYVWQRDQITGPGYFVVSGVLLAVSLVWFAVLLVGWRRARRELAEVGEGTALSIGRAGVELAGAFVPWADVVSLAARPRGLGRSPVLRLDRRDGAPLDLALELVDVRPATLDTTARAYSAGRHGVDLQALDS